MIWISSSGGVSRWSLAAGGKTPSASRLASALPPPQYDWAARAGSCSYQIHCGSRSFRPASGHSPIGQTPAVVRDRRDRHRGNPHRGPSGFHSVVFQLDRPAAGVLGLYVFGLLGINLCFHRLLTHRGFVCPKWLEHSLAILGLCCVQDTPARWVAIHRRHHEHADEQTGPSQPAGRFSLGAYRMDDLQKQRSDADGPGDALCQGHHARSVLRKA